MQFQFGRVAVINSVTSDKNSCGRILLHYIAELIDGIAVANTGRDILLTGIIPWNWLRDGAICTQLHALSVTNMNAEPAFIGRTNGNQGCAISLCIVLSGGIALLVLIGYFFPFPPPEMDAMQYRFQPVHTIGQEYFSQPAPDRFLNPEPLADHSLWLSG